MTPTLQESYDRIKTYFSRPDAVIAVGEGEGAGCVYRTAEGNACAVGCLIPDENYRWYFEVQTVKTLLHNLEHFDRETLETMISRAKEGSDDGGGAYIPDEDMDKWANDFDFEAEAENAAKVYAILDDDKRKVEFLSAAQDLHDRGSHTAGVFLTRLRNLAAEYGLKV